MTCPKCQMVTPDGSWRCDNCGAVFGTPNAPARDGFRPPSSRHARRLSLLLGVVVTIAAVGMAALFVFKPGTTSHAANVASPGAETDVSRYIQPGKMNIVDFFSQYCPPCRQISPRLAKLAAKRSDIVVIKMDINRPGVEGIDWSSPLARQYNLQSIPHFQVWDKDGRMVSEGEPASATVMALLAQEGLIE